MRIVSIEPTPSPNSMKLNMDVSLPQGMTHNVSINNDKGSKSPEYIQELLRIDGVTGVFQVTDFIALERHPKSDWKVILPQARAVFGPVNGAEHQTTSTELTDTKVADEGYGEVNVFVQMFKGIPMQVRLTSGTEEQRVGLEDRFLKAAMDAEPSSPNMVMEREWVEQDVRYGTMEEVGESVAQEIAASYDSTRLSALVKQAFKEESDPQFTRKTSSSEIMSILDDPDWKKRYAALEKMSLEDANIPVLRKALQDVKMSVRRLATAYLGDIGGKESLQLLYVALEDTSPAVRRTAGDALSDIGDPEAIGALLMALKDRNKLVRWRAARFMYELGDESAISALKEAANDPEFEVSLQAKLALERIEGGHRAEGSIWQQMTARNNDDSTGSESS